MFFNWDHHGLRFNLQKGETDTDEYFTEVLKRATTIFESVFENTDNIFIILLEYKYKRRKIKFNNYVFKQIEALKQSEVIYYKEYRLYEPNKFDIRNIAIIKTTAKKVNYGNIFKAIAHTDFAAQEPRLDKYGVLTSKEVYFLNIDKRLIFHMYDDRGLDIISADKEILTSIYKKHHSWLLDVNREKMDKKFE